MPIKLVSFDTDDTLYDFMSLSRGALAAVAELARNAIGPEAAALTRDDVIADLEQTAEEMEHPYAQIPELRRRSFTRTLSRFGRQDEKLVEEMGKLYERLRFATVAPFVDARPTLEQLAKRYALCAISNGEQDMKMLGLDDLFAFVVTATDVGYQKPDPRIFAAAMKKAGCSAGEMAHVGDSLRHDVAGAKAAGAWAIWFNPVGRPNAYDFAPDREIRSLSELPKILSALR